MMTRLAFLFAAALSYAQPPFAPFGVAVRNAATNQSVVAPGSLISITPLASAIQPLTGVTAELRFGTSDTVRALPFLAAPNNIGAWALIPNDAPDGDIFVSLLHEGARYTDRVIVQRAAPGLFTQRYSSFGPALALNYLGGPPTRNGLTSAAVPDRFIALFATGLHDAKAEDVSVNVGGQTVAASFAGPQGTPGLGQINFIVPKDAYLGCYVPVSIRVRGVLSNTATLSINVDTYACAHPLGLSYNDMKTLDAGGSIPLGNLSLGSIQPDSSPLSERAAFFFASADASTVALYAGVQTPESTFLTCFTTGISGGAAGVLQGAIGDAGVITLAGPRGQEFEMVSPYFGTVSPGPPRFFTPGEWHVRAPGGTVFFPFDQVFTLPPAIDSINIAPGSTVSSEEELEIRWNPVVFGPNDLVVVYSPGGVCTTRAWNGRITMPKPVPSILSGIQIVVVPHPAGRAQFDLLMRDGRIMRAFVSYSFSLSLPVVVK